MQLALVYTCRLPGVYSNLAVISLLHQQHTIHLHSLSTPILIHIQIHSHHTVKVTIATHQ
jgi:hypothetical protein